MITRTLSVSILTVLVACGTTETKSDAGAKVCVPGASVACVGKGGCAGAQICNASGTALEACDCGNDPDSGDPDGAAMSDGGTEGGDASTTECVAVLAPGYDYSCALKLDGTVWCWGDNTHGQLGDGTTSPKTTPVQVATLGNAVTQLSASDMHVCARKADGSAWCWGLNNTGQLGDNSVGTDRSTPVQVPLGNVVAEIGVGGQHTCARKNDNTVWCFGSNGAGELGLGTITNNEPLPVQFPVTGMVVGVSAGLTHTCVVKNDGTVWCAGDNSQGQIGDGSQGGGGCGGSCKPIPTQTNTSNVATIVVSHSAAHSCAIKKDGSLWCWGANGSYEIGDGIAGARLSPVQVLQSVSHVALGAGYTCARKTDSSMWCWGFNGFGELGTGNFTDVMLPKMVLMSTTTIGVGNRHTCATSPAACWGYNKFGQLGDGTTTGQTCKSGNEPACRPSPVTVKSLCP